MQNKLLITFVKLILTQIVIPMAENYVKSTENTWDDKALEFLVELEQFIIAKLNSN